MKPAVYRECTRCGCTFPSTDEKTEICLACRVTEDMKLPPDTIVNRSLVSIWMSKNYDPVKGIDPAYLMVAEGAYLVQDRVRDNHEVYSTIAFIGEKDDSEMESYAKNLKYRKDIRKKYDAMVFIRISQKSKFHVFGIKYSDRMVKKLSNKTAVFQKQYAISLSIKWFMKNR